MYKFNVKDATEKCISWIKEWFDKNGSSCNAVIGISGGKDSLLLGVLLQMFQKYSKIPFRLTGLSMDPGYLPAARAQIDANIQALGLNTHQYNT